MKKFGANDYVSSALILLALTILTHSTGLFSRVDNLLFDIGQRLHHQAAPADIVIIGIDENSLSQLGRWPWSRQTHAALLNTLQKEGAAAIGLDIIFSEPESNDESHAGDKALVAAIKQAGNVVLPVMLESTRLNGQVIETLPLSEYADSAADLGRVHAVLDEDGIARSIYLHEGVGAPVWQHFAQAILNVAQHQPSKNNFSQSKQADANNGFSLVRSDQRRIRFLGAAGHFSTISYAQVLRGEFTKGLFKNKIVLVGATAFGLGDTFPTPVTSAQQLMPGVEFHANVLQSIRSNSLIKTVLPSVSLLIMALIALLPLFWLPKLSALIGLMTTLLALVLVSFAAVMMPQLSGVWLPPSAALCSLLLAYPIWSWRKLEAARRYLDNELHQLKQSLMHAPATTNAHVAYDHFDARIDQVRAAGAQLRFLQEDRKETLAFISHDLRAPLARAMMVLQENNVPNQELMGPLSQALNLAEDFLQASRAEMLDSSHFKELDFASLVHQAVDDAFEAAKKKGIKLERDITDDLVWVNGNFGLLQRAMLNLILNAIKFSPEHALVKIQLSVENQQTTFSVIDHGPGVAAEQQEKLFKRFSRTAAGAAATEGVGLGLYFVHTVAEKHHGSVSVQSEMGVTTCFSFSLPIVSI
jgi:CHASE2 domain-containing sensor protein/nitrogen-specific signal transduction histidine kinase